MHHIAKFLSAREKYNLNDHKNIQYFSICSQPKFVNEDQSKEAM